MDMRNKLQQFKCFLFTISEHNLQTQKINNWAFWYLCGPATKIALSDSPQSYVKQLENHCMDFYKI